MPKKLTTFSMRMPEDINDRIQAYAAEHECTKAEAMSHFARAGIELEDNGAPAAAPDAAPSADLSGLTKKLDALEATVREGTTAATAAREAATSAKDAATSAKDAAALARVGLAKSTPTIVIVPVDIKDKIQAYSAEHACTDQEALLYYARIGVTMTAADRPATVSALQELSKKLDAVAADGAAKNEQLKALAASIAKIEANTTPETVEVEGELADPAIEEAKDALEEERREAERDERTRKIINEAMDSYLQKAKPAEPAPAPQQNNMLLPILVSAVVALAIGLIVLLLAKG